MVHLFMLIIFLIQFLVVLGALVIVIFFARPIVPLSGYSPQESPAPRGEAPFRGKLRRAH
jgi:hypothetical protein